MPKLDALVRAAAVADAHVHFTFDWPNDSVALDLRDGVGDAVLVMREDIDDSARPELRFARLGFDPVRIARQLLELTIDPRDYVDRDRAAGYIDSLEQLSRTRYVVIVYLHQLRMPVLVGSQYEGGLLGGAGLLVDLDEMRFRGGFEFGAGSSWEVRAKDATIERVLVDDLARHFYEAMLTKLAQRFPDAKLPVTLGY
jgi:hypothetical protein